ncbi:unnamed protein product [Protopolystoma xenopodis]|uniref:Uncharacterized protein n=1 Tax=Protopolystoma xenopodis TaxID=117903 RepID=A0A3S5B105_9PLAT|nr:unnamed protein product [Protopolystoma xenopodis]
MLVSVSLYKDQLVASYFRSDDKHSVALRREQHPVLTCILLAEICASTQVSPSETRFLCVINAAIYLACGTVSPGFQHPLSSELLPFVVYTPSGGKDYMLCLLLQFVPILCMMQILLISPVHTSLHYQHESYLLLQLCSAFLTSGVRRTRPQVRAGGGGAQTGISSLGA